MPKVSQLLTRVLAREHDGRDDASSSSGSEENYDLQQMAANASAGLRMGERFNGVSCCDECKGQDGYLLVRQVQQGESVAIVRDTWVFFPSSTHFNARQESKIHDPPKYTRTSVKLDFGGGCMVE